MFVSVMKNKFVRWVIYAVLGVFSLYNGIAAPLCCIKRAASPACWRGRSGSTFWVIT